MKNLFLCFLFVPFFAFSKNFTTFGGGNFAYVESGSIHFNFDKYVFDHRAWSYDGQNFSSQINVQMALKTKYVSTQEWFEVVLKNKNDVFMYAKYIKEPFSSKTVGHYQVTAIPFVVAGVGAVVAGAAALTTFNDYSLSLPENDSRRSTPAVNAYFALLGAASIKCVLDDCHKVRNVAHVVTLKNGNVYRVSDANDYTKQVIPDLVEFIESYYGSKVNGDECHGGTLSVGSSFQCGYYSPGSWAVQNVQNVQLVEQSEVSESEFLSILHDVATQYPSEVINEPTDGKKIENVQLSSAAVSRPTSVLSPPYTDPVTGLAQQDQIFIGGASSGIGVNSATNTSWEYSSSSSVKGESAATNAPVTVSTVARPDLAGDRILAPVGTVTSQTGVANPPAVSNPPATGDINIEFPEFTDIAEFCKANPDAGACLNLKPDDSKPTPLLIPVDEIPLDFTVNQYVSGVSACPAPSVATFSFFGSRQNIPLSFEPFCAFADYLKYVVLLLSWVLAFRIVMGRSD